MPDATATSPVPEMRPELRGLILRVNRTLLASLTEASLITAEDVGVANDYTADEISGPNGLRMSAYVFLAHNRKCIREDAIIQRLVEDHENPPIVPFGLIDIHNFEIPEEIRRSLDLEFCRATMCVPFDSEDGMHMLAVAPAYYMSPAVRSFWEKKLGGPIIWYLTPHGNMEDFLTKLEEERKGAKK